MDIAGLLSFTTGCLLLSEGYAMDCPSGFTWLGGSSCYAVNLNTKFTHRQSRLHCGRLNATLAVLADDQEMQIVLSWLGSYHKPYYTGVWIGLGRGETGEWVWDDGQPFDPASWDFGIWEPRTAELSYGGCLYRYGTGRFALVPNGASGALCQTSEDEVGDLKTTASLKKITTMQTLKISKNEVFVKTLRRFV